MSGLGPLSVSVVGAARRVVLSAFGIHVGGGRVLLDALMVALSPVLKAAALDVRYEPPPDTVSGSWCRMVVYRSFRARWVALRKLHSFVAPDDVLFCFNSLPPLRKVAGRVVVFVHAPHFAGLHQGIRYSMVTTLRIQIERMWFALGVKHCDEIWVQTRTMQDAMTKLYPSKAVRVRPLVDDMLLAKLSALGHGEGAACPPIGHEDFRFFYPADAVGHKNHRTLLKAWDLLAQRGCRPLLVLTLRPEELQALRAGTSAASFGEARIQNLGWQPRERVLQEMAHSSAMIFPSLAETFGIPLLEARAFGLPVLAAERDFVRDVCQPHETFDPESPHSIAMAVLRFIGGEVSDTSEFYSAKALLEELLQ